MNGIFGYADDPWIPTLLDIERLKKAEDADVAAYFSAFGWENLEVPDGAVHVRQRMDALNWRFIARYGTRMIAHETMEIWQVRLQDVFDSIVYKYERAYTIYERYTVEMMEDAIPGTTTETKGTNTAGGADFQTADSRYSDTPDSAINTSDDFAGSITKNSGSTEYGRTDTVDTKVRHTITGGAVMDAVNSTIQGWRDVDTDFIAEFENLFSNVLWA